MQTLTYNEEKKEAILYCGTYIQSSAVVKKFTDCEVHVHSDVRIIGIDKNKKPLFYIPMGQTNLIFL